MKLILALGYRKIVVIHLLFATLASFAQGYNISIKLRGCSENSLVLYQYLGNEEIAIDTAHRSANGDFILSSKEAIDKGLYKLSWQNNKRFFDLLLVNSLPFKIDCDIRDVLSTTKVEGSEENKIFYGYLSFLKSTLHTNKKSPANDTTTAILGTADFGETGTREYVNSLFVQYPGFLSVKILRAFVLSYPPNSDISLNKLDRSLPSKQFLKKHYFDNFDFTDIRLVASPALITRIDSYFDQIIEPETDSIIAGIGILFQAASKNKQSQKFLAWQLISKFGTHYFLPGYDEAYVFIIRKYMQTGKIAWYYPETKEREINLANQFEPLFTGKTAPDLVFPDTNNKARKLSEVKSKYTLLLFWASTCSHCRDDMPQIISAYTLLHRKADFEIFAVSTDTSEVRWKNYIKRYNLPWFNVFGRKKIKEDYFDLYHIQSTPTLFLLDEKKRILAKYITPNEINQYISAQGPNINPF
jgi:thiol-disulfide isomerase/thioredoxin